MQHNYSFVQTHQYIKGIAPVYKIKKPLHLGSQWSNLVPSSNLGNFLHFLYDTEDKFGISLSYRTHNVKTVRDFVLLVHSLSHNKTK